MLCPVLGGVVNVYDSLYSSVSNKTIHLIANMVYSSSSTLEVRMMDVAKQSDCGILSIAYAFDLCSGNDPCEVKYDHKKNQTAPGHVLGELPVVTISFVVRTKKLLYKVCKDSRPLLFMSYARGKQ